MMETRNGRTTTETMQARTKPETPVIWEQPVKPACFANLTKNMGVAAALLVCLVALRGGAIPQATELADAVLTAATGDTLLDDQLGRLTFVSRLFPDATLVFGEMNGSLAMPVSGAEVVHAWSESEPYTLWSADGRRVFSPLAGEVMGVYHGENEELIVHVMREDGLSVLCGNLAESAVFTGDSVEEGALLGCLQEGAACFFEVRQDGWSVDPAALLRP